MSNHWLFFLNADGWLVSPESCPYPNEEHAIEAAYRALRCDATGELETELLFPDRIRHDNFRRSNDAYAGTGVDSTT
jgi:hypothetical protein